MKYRNICVLGGTGFVGQHLVGKLAAKGYHIRVLTRRRERHRDLLVLPTVEVVDADVQNPTELQRQFAGMDVVINLVGILNERGHKGDGFQRAHVELTHKVVDAMRKNGVRRLLHMSALGADAKQGTSHYQRSKGQAENLVLGATDLDVTAFRPSVIFGPGDSFFNRFADLLKKVPLLFPLASAQARFQPVYVGDVAEAFLRALPDRASFGQRYDLCGPRVHSLRALVSYTAEQVGANVYVMPLSDGLSRLQAYVMEYVPGKPFSIDNYRSTLVDNVCGEDYHFPFGIKPTSIEAVVPAYLAHKRARDRYDEFRGHAHRD